MVRESDVMWSLPVQRNVQLMTHQVVSCTVLSVVRPTRITRSIKMVPSHFVTAHRAASCGLKVSGRGGRLKGRATVRGG